MKPFVVVSAGEVHTVMQVCPDVVINGECRQALWCDCAHSDDGPLWQERRCFARLADALAQVEVLTVQFQEDCQRHRAVIERLRARAAGKPVQREGLADDGVPY